MEKNDAEKIISELGDLKKLLVLNLLDKGYSQNQIALALGVNQTTISRMFPKGVLNKKRISSVE
jgi:predicted transcriptional regulator